jgi:hypothetical protein
MQLSTPMMRWIVAPRVNTETGDEFGAAVALSADGGTLAVGAAGEDSSAVGLDGDRSDESAADAGAAYLY